MTTYNVRLQGSDGKEYITSFAGLLADLKNELSFEEKRGWTNVTRKLREDVDRLNDIILEEVLVPKAKDAVIEFLKDNPDVQTRSFYDKQWLDILRSHAWYIAQQELEEEGKIVSVSHGRGRNRTWNLKETKL